MKWRCKDGRILSPREMETQHIHNCIAMLERNGYCSTEDALNALGAASSCHGEMASYYAEQEASGMKPVQIFDEFLEELERRRRKPVYFCSQ